ncbi:MAG: hypothetical protein L0215_22350 [Gemmataceae bacterium]|nr:hypothetical protein [Gemmataceae bacterium]
MLSRVRRWWKSGAVPPTPVFQVSCPCGHVARGTRTAEHQAVPCPRCGRVLFILPTSPWTALARHAGAAQSPSAWRRRDWLLPVAASALAALALFMVYRFLIAPYWFSTKENGDLPTSAEARFREQLQIAQQLLGEGQFRLALQSLYGPSPPKGRMEAPAELTEDERRQWTQVELQAAVLADLLHESLEDILRHAAGSRDSEWQLEFANRYEGRSLVLDAEFRKQGQSWQTSFPLQLGKENARLIVDNLELLNRLPGQEPHRLVLGVRLASVRLEAPGPVWTVRLQAGSGVLLTHFDAAVRVCPALADPEGRALLDKQKKWLFETPR